MDAPRPHASEDPRFAGLDIAAIVPCYNEEASIGKVVSDLREALPSATVYVYDNRSTDATAEIAGRHGAVVRHERRKGKGNVVRRAFGDIDADVYLMIDGDDTYDAFAAPEMISLLLDGPYDHVLGARQPVEDAENAYRLGHETGNRMINEITGWVFGSRQDDMLSGYRVMSKRFVKSFPAVSREFEIETELTVHTHALRVPNATRTVGFRDRPANSESKLNTYRDGFKILRLILQLARHERPIAVYGALSVLSFLLGGALLLPIVSDYLQTQQVPRFPSLIAAVFLWLLSALGLMVGLILDGIRKSRHEHARLMYLRYPAAGEGYGPVPGSVYRRAEDEAPPQSHTEDAPHAHGSHRSRPAVARR